MFPDLPPGGVASVAEGASLPDSRVVHLAFPFNDAAPGPMLDTFAYAKTVAHRNLFWITVK
jgi:hypothetical protein